MRDYVGELIKLVGKDEEQAYKLAEQFLEKLQAEIQERRALIDSVENFRRMLTPRLVEREFSPTTQVVPRIERPDRIREVALELVSMGDNVVTTRGILARLKNRGFDLGVKQPYAVVGTVLSRLNEFKRVDVNTFEYIGGE